MLIVSNKGNICMIVIFNLELEYNETIKRIIYIGAKTIQNAVNFYFIIYLHIDRKSLR
jgi:hypothetical protein